MKDVLLEVGRFAVIAVLSGVGILALVSIISGPGIMVRYAITHSTTDQAILVADGLRCALVAAVLTFIARHMIKLIFDI